MVRDDSIHARADADDILTPFYASHKLNYAESSAKYRGRRGRGAGVSR